MSARTCFFCSEEPGNAITMGECGRLDCYMIADWVLNQRGRHNYYTPWAWHTLEARRLAMINGYLKWLVKHLRLKASGKPFSPRLTECLRAASTQKKRRLSQTSPTK